MGDQVWDDSILEAMESHLVQAINAELVLQKQFDKERDDRTDLAL